MTALIPTTRRLQLPACICMEQQQIRGMSLLHQLSHMLGATEYKRLEQQFHSDI
jgi:hypothetical protein